MTPEEDLKQKRKEKWIWVGSSIFVIGLALLLAFGVGYLLPLKGAVPSGGRDRAAIGRIIQMVIFISISGLGGWLIARTRRKILERKLGRGVYGDHELTSLTSWMEASRREEERANRNDMNS